ncbi:MAG: helix-turn-helix domain-containing protein [Candidatus Absconditabacteria bacterium]
MGFQPDIAVVPGWKIREEIESLGSSNGEFAERLGISEKHLSQILNGKVSLTFDIAEKLELVTNIKSSFWNKLEQAYQEDKARLENEKRLELDLKLLSKFTCYKNLVKLGLVEKTTDKMKKLKNLLKVFRLTSLSILCNSESKLIENVAYRKSHNHTVSKENLITWIKVGERIVNGQELGDYSKSKLKNVVTELKKMTKDQSKVDIKKITQLLNSIGIYFVVLEHFEKVPVNGISRLYNKKPMIQMSLRQKWMDIFWFTLFHELGHIYNGDIKEEIIIIDSDTTQPSDIEDLANEFAKNCLINPKNFDKCIASKNEITEIDLKELAEIEGIGINIVAGRITHELKGKQSNIYSLTNKLRPRIN